MENIARLTHLHDEIHTVTGIIAILLMFIHAMWAIWTYVKGSERAKEHFNRFGIRCGAFVDTLLHSVYLGDVIASLIINYKD